MLYISLAFFITVVKNQLEVQNNFLNILYI